MSTWVQPRNAGHVLLFSIFTCGLYQLIWYHDMYADLVALDHKTPTGHGYWIDLLLTVLTCGLWGIYVDYQITLQLDAMAKARGMNVGKDNATLVVVLDVAAYVSGWMTNLMTTAMHQDQLNKLLAGPAPTSAARGR